MYIYTYIHYNYLQFENISNGSSEGSQISDYSSLCNKILMKRLQDCQNRKAELVDRINEPLIDIQGCNGKYSYNTEYSPYNSSDSSSSSSSRRPSKCKNLLQSKTDSNDDIDKISKKSSSVNSNIDGNASNRTYFCNGVNDKSDSSCSSSNRTTYDHSRVNMLVYLFYMPKLIFAPFISNEEFSKFVIDGGTVCIHII